MSIERYVADKAIDLGELADLFPDRTNDSGSTLGKFVNGGFKVRGVVVNLSVRGGESAVSLTGDDKDIGRVYAEIRKTYRSLAPASNKKRGKGCWGG